MRNSILFSRNILPKPTAAPSTTTGLGQPHHNSSSSSPILTNYITSGATPINLDAASAKIVPFTAQQQHDIQMQLHQIQQHQQQQNHAINEFLMNGNTAHHHATGGVAIGRQGPIKDVRSIIDDYRQKHPEMVPRRGRRRKGFQ